MKTKLIKKMAIPFLMAATLLAFSSCGKDNTETNTNTNTDAPATVADSEWMWSDSNNSSGVIDLKVEFNGPMLADLTYTDMSTGVMQTDVLLGTYTYSNGSGTLTLNDESNDTTVNISFSVSGTTMTLSFKAVTYRLTKKE